MSLRSKLPVSYLLFTKRGRISRLTLLNGLVFLIACFYIFFNIINYSIGYKPTIILYPILLYALVCLFSKRLHDTSWSGWTLLVVLIPVIGPLYLLYRLFLKRGAKQENKYGQNHNVAADYFKNPEAEKIVHLKTEQRIVNDVTGLNPIIVEKVYRPKTPVQVQEIISSSNDPISVGGGRFSMGGQTASPGTIHLDMRSLNKIESIDEVKKEITVQPGVRWCDIQAYADKYNLSVKIMQTYANFTVGGSLSVNVHGRYMGLGPLVLSVNEITLVLANGKQVVASKEHNQILFYAAIGGYNAVGVIVQAKLQLTENSTVERVYKKMATSDYFVHFKNTIRENKQVVFHNADMYPKDFKRLKSISWVKTSKKATVKNKLMPLRASYPFERYFMWAFTTTPLGKFRREYIIEPLIYLSKKVHYKNYEAGYDVAELEPRSRKDFTYVLQEYFVPIEHFDRFADEMADIYQKHDVNVVNISVRHAIKDPGTYLAWAKDEVFAFVVYYKQSTKDYDKNKVAIWTRELIDAAIKYNGSYYLPYQVHATSEQFHKAYPRAKELFKIKQQYDPDFRFRNVIWDTYYKPYLEHENKS